MTERPILFSAEMVRAILDGRKTQTRRIVKPQPTGATSWLPHIEASGFYPDKISAKPERLVCKYGQSGDQLWVRETWAKGETAGVARYRATDPQCDDTTSGLRWRPSIHMPRWASRITLRITDIRVERLQDISEDDARAEGCEARPFPGPWWQGYRDLGDGKLFHQQAVGETPPDWMIEPKKMPPTPWLDRSARDNFRSIWMGLHGPDAWEANPWVWVISFERVKP